MNRQDIPWWGGVAFWIGLTILLWVLAIRAARRDEKEQKEREDLIEDQKLYLLVADYLTEQERAQRGWRDCANEPDLEFQLRRSVELQAEKNDLGRAS